MDYFKKLFDYDLWANNLIIDSFVNNSIHDVNIELLFSHILNCQQVWLNRIKGYTADKSPWDIIPAHDFQHISIFVNKDWFELLNSSTKINEIIKYKNIKGEPFENTIQDILIHNLNHSTYHRAQISSKLNTLGINPPITDYIEFVRRR